MTTLTKALRRTVPGHGRDLVWIMEPLGLSVREKGRRTTYGPIPWGKLFVYLVTLTVAQREVDRHEGLANARRAQRAKKGTPTVSRNLLQRGGR